MPALNRIRKIVLDPKTSDADALRAAREILNRTGFSERFAVELAPDDKWTALLDGAIIVEDRSLSEFPPTPQLETDYYDRQQLALSMTDDNFREQHRADAAEYEARPSYANEQTIPGEVVDAPRVSAEGRPLPPPPQRSRGPTPDPAQAEWEQRLKASIEEAERDYPGRSTPRYRR